MTYHQFVNEVERKVKGCVAENVMVRTHVAIKNNSCERRGIMMAEKGINISPTIYLEEYYKEFLNGEPLEQIAKVFLHVTNRFVFDNHGKRHLFNLLTISNALLSIK